MADNTTLPATGETVRTLDKGGKKTQVVSLDLGGTGAESLASGSIPVTGTFWQATQPVSGTVAVSNFPASQAVTGTFWQATQPVSGPLTDTQLRASAVPVSGTFWQTTQPVSIASMPSTPVTGTFWQATQPVSIASWTGLTDTQLRASAVPVSLASLPALATGSNTIGAVTAPGAAALALDASLTGHAQTFKSVTVVTALSSANTTVTATLSAVASQFHYITRIRIVNVNPTTTAIAAAATTLSYTTTNLPGSLAWTSGTLLAAGAEKVIVDEVLSQPLKSSVVNTNTTIVAPAIGTGGLCRITVYYYTAA